MIEFEFNQDVPSLDEDKHKDWINRVCLSEGMELGEIHYTFCSDTVLHKMNRSVLNHDTLTDIITFDLVVGRVISGDIFISTDRVSENAQIYNVSFEEELRRVMVHGVLHLCGYVDKTAEEKGIMRALEDKKLEMFHVEQ